MRNAILAAGLVLAGISANLTHLPGPESEERHSEQTRPRSGGQPGLVLPGDHPVITIYDYFNQNAAAETVSGNPSGSPEPGGSRGHSKLELKCEVTASDAAILAAMEPIRRGEIEFVIATVPDPQKTHLALDFDRYTESIISAAADSGYSFDRYWLPWRIEVEPEYHDLDSHKRSEAEKEARERWPGLLLFRGLGEGPVPRALAIFLVGETPTSGIDRPQFRNAVGFIGKLRNSAGRETPRILGPNFSGSLNSLHRAIVEDLADDPEPTVVSGAASSQADLVQFQECHAYFETTLHSDKYAIEGLVAGGFFDNQRGAIVAEDATAYGRQFENREGSEPNEKSQPLIIYYPREISRLRNAYQDDPGVAELRKEQGALGIRQQLMLGLKDSQTARDTLPQFSAAQTPITQETALQQIADTLKREEIGTAIIIGTNALDVLFVSRFLHESDSDLLFVHGADSLNYFGMLAATTYPLVPENQFWTEPPARKDGSQTRVRRFFASANAEGIYNACLLLLHPERKGAVPLREYSAPGLAGGDHPPVWVTTVGRGGYWPVAVLDGKDADPVLYRDKQGSQRSSFRMAAPTRVWTTFFCLSSLVVLAFLAALVYAQTSSTALKRWCADLNPAPDGEARTDRVLWLLCTVTCVFLTYWIVAVAPVSLAFVDSPWHWRVAAACATVLCFLLTGSLTFSAREFLPSQCRLALAVAVLLSVVVLSLVVLSLGWAAIAAQNGRGLFRVLRSVQLASGVSPILPFLFLIAALGWWAWTQLQRAIFVQERSVPLPCIAGLPGSIAGGLKERLMGPPYGDLTGTLVAGATFIASLAAGVWGLRSLESRAYDVVFSVLFALVAASLLGTGYFYLRIWRDLRQLLESLELHPIRDAFSRLPGTKSWSPLWQSNARKRSYTIPARSLDCLRRLCTLAPWYCQRLSKHLRVIEVRWTAVLAPVEKGERETARAARRAQSSAARIATRLGERLEKVRWRRGTAATLDRIEEKAPSTAPKDLDDPDMLAAEFIALRYLAFIRYVMLHLRNLFSFLTVGFILAVIAMNSYAFQGGSLFRCWITSIFGALAVVVIDVFVEMERDAVLSRLTDGTAGKIESGFYFKVIAGGTLPLLAVVASHFPAAGRFLFSWIQPALSALH